MYYPEEAIEEVRSRSDIVAVVSSRVKLTKRGGNYFGCCPFHNEKTPSFCVSPARQMYHCFGCGAGGNVISFLMAYENYSFPEALEHLAAKAGITLPKREQTSEEKAKEGLRNRLLAVHAEAAKYYYFLLRSEGGAAGLRYFSGRGLTQETMRRFGLGYAAGAWDGLYRYLRGKEFTDAELKDSGLILFNDRGGRDRFRDRVMFPIMDKNSRVIGFGGRILGSGEPKYLNSPETPLFDKSRNLYGLHIARASRRPYFLLCEGYMDVIALHQAGFDCAVASLGTSLTQGHALLMKRYKDRVILTYDSDGAGIKAAMRAIPLLREAGLEVRVLNMRPYKDPDEFIVHEGAEAYEERIAKAENYFLFQTDVWKTEYEMSDPTERTKYHTRLAEALTAFSDALERENYLTAACSRHSISAAMMRELVGRIGNRRMGQETRQETLPEEEARDIPPVSRRRVPEEGLLSAERLMLVWAAGADTAAAGIRKTLREDDFEEEIHRELLRKILELKERGESPAPAALVNLYLEDEDKSKAVAAVFSDGMIGEDNEELREKVLSESLRRLRKRSLNKALRAEGMDQKTMQQLVQELRALPSLKIG